jgi:hypothetical protein
MDREKDVLNGVIDRARRDAERAGDTPDKIEVAAKQGR